jgi:hypothetical protein
MPNRPSPPRLGLTVEEAAAAVGMSESSFKRHVQPELRIVRRGSLRIIPVPEIERWLEGNARVAGVTQPGWEFVAVVAPAVDGEHLQPFCRLKGRNASGGDGALIA